MLLILPLTVISVLIFLVIITEPRTPQYFLGPKTEREELQQVLHITFDEQQEISQGQSDQRNREKEKLVSDLLMLTQVTDPSYNQEFQKKRTELLSNLAPEWHLFYKQKIIYTNGLVTQSDMIYWWGEFVEEKVGGEKMKQIMHHRCFS